MGVPGSRPARMLLALGATPARGVEPAEPGGAAARGARRPNFLLLMPDQWRHDWDGARGGNGTEIPLDLPNLRALQAGGVRFTQAYVPSPVCAPSRSCMASLREYDAAGTATCSANDYNISIPTHT